MKKFLSLVLALVMTMSLVTVSAGAKDFTDDSSITYKEAVDVMSAIGVIDGYENGTFGPKGTLTRGAAAKIICNLILGPTTAAALSADAAPYSDVPVDNVFAGYIAYCQKTGIISGYADGTFRPGNSLTGYAFMKMLLGALGYDAAKEGYTGDNWSIAVAKRALNVGLADDLEGEFNGVKAVTREEACLYAFNTLKATMVEYENDTTITAGNVTVSTSSKAKETTNKAETETIKNDDLMQFAEKYFPKLTLTKTEHDDFMRPAHEWKYKKTSIGTYADAPDAVYTVKVKGKEIRADLTADYKNADIELYVDGVEADLDTDFAVNKNNSKKIGANGLLTEVYVIDAEDEDDDDTLRIVQINTYAATVDADYDDEDETVALTVESETGDFDSSYELELDDFAMIKGLKEDDVVLLTISGIDEDKDGVVKSIVKAESTTAAVTNYESNYDDGWMDEKDSVTAGEKYSYAALFAAGIDNFDGNYVIKDEYDFYLDSYGYVIYVEGVTADKNYVYIDGFEASGVSSKATLKGYAYFVDGKTELISVKTIDDVKDIKGTEAIYAALAGLFDDDANGLFTYTEKNGKYTLKTVKTNGVDMAPAIDLNDENNADLLDDGKLVLADALDFADVRGSKNTKFIVIDEDDETTVYTGIKNVPVITVADADEDDDHAYIAFSDDDSALYAEYVFIDLGDTASTSGRSKGGDVMFLYENGYAKKGVDSDENTYYTYKVIKDGKQTTVKFDEDCSGLTAGLYIGVKYDEDGYACEYEKVTYANYPVGNKDTEDYSFGGFSVNCSIEKKGDVLTLWNGDTHSVGYYMADDCTVTFIVDEEIKNVSWKKIDAEDGNYAVNGSIWGVMNSDNEYTELYIQLVKVEAED